MGLFQPQILMFGQIFSDINIFGQLSDGPKLRGFCLLPFS